MIRLTREQILGMQKELVAHSGGISGLRDESMFESAIAAPFHTFGGHDAFPTIPQKAVRLGFGLIMNHPFIDGNKRIGTHAMLATLEINGIRLEYAQEDFYRVIMEVASGNLSFEGLLDWVMGHEKQ